MQPLRIDAGSTLRRATRGRLVPLCLRCPPVDVAAAWAFRTGSVGRRIRHDQSTFCTFFRADADPPASPAGVGGSGRAAAPPRRTGRPTGTRPYRFVQRRTGYHGREEFLTSAARPTTSTGRVAAAPIPPLETAKPRRRTEPLPPTPPSEPPSRYQRAKRAGSLESRGTWNQQCLLPGLSLLAVATDPAARTDLAITARFTCSIPTAGAEADDRNHRRRISRSATPATLSAQAYPSTATPEGAGLRTGSILQPPRAHR